jgi:hypothetical protein
MKTRRRLIQFCLLGAWLLALPAAVQAQFTFITNNGAITITGYTGPIGAVTIPGSINSLTVDNIGTNAFDNNQNLISVTIPDSVTNIGDNAFYNCNRLTNAIIGNGVIVIGEYAFSCFNLSSVTIGNHVVIIGNGAFNGCNLLTNALIPDGVTSIGNNAFDDTGMASNHNSRQRHQPWLRCLRCL